MRPEVIAGKLLQDSGAVLTNGHFVYTSGQHGRTYIDKAAVTSNPLVCSTLCRLLADQIGFEPEIEVVVAPAVGAIPLGQWVAFHLTELYQKPVVSAYAEKEAEGFALKRGYSQAVKGKVVAVVEDILTTGGSARSVINAIQAAGGIQIMVGALCNRGGVTAEALRVGRLEALLDLNAEMWPASECPLCSRGVAINTEFGHGAEFLARQGA